mmetsp:Transcript_16067/g.45559  ORF Transcript_16067/g.45559 Transcript_16067/m.45559 type:complete len:308 (+) Transcript_16067:2697-3620(+)
MTKVDRSASRSSGVTVQLLPEARCLPPSASTFRGGCFGKLPSYLSASCWHRRCSQPSNSRTFSSSARSSLCFEGGVGGLSGASRNTLTTCVMASGSFSASLPETQTRPSTSSFASSEPPALASVQIILGGRFRSSGVSSPSRNCNGKASTEWTVARLPQSSHAIETSTCSSCTHPQAWRRPQSGNLSLSMSGPKASSLCPDSGPGPFHNNVSSWSRPVSYASRSSPALKGPCMPSMIAAPVSTSSRGVALSSSSPTSTSSSDDGSASGTRSFANSASMSSTGESGTTSPKSGKARGVTCAPSKPAVV